MSSSKNIVVGTCFPSDEATSLKRPATAATQFRSSVNALVDILRSKNPSYVRCIKPNMEKRSGFFDEQIVRHQVKKKS